MSSTQARRWAPLTHRRTHTKPCLPSFPVMTLHSLKQDDLEVASGSLRKRLRAKLDRWQKKAAQAGNGQQRHFASHPAEWRLLWAGVPPAARLYIWLRLHFGRDWSFSWEVIYLERLLTVDTVAEGRRLVAEFTAEQRRRSPLQACLGLLLNPQRLEHSLCWGTGPDGRRC